MMNSNNKKLLSIVIPTLNRRQLLEETINALLIEIKGFESEVEFIVINNASDDDTDVFLTEKCLNTKVKYLSFTERVNIDDSFLRCITHSNGHFINIFGDDDLPLPGYVSRLINLIKSDSNIGIIYLNRLIGDENLINIGEVAHGSFGLSIQNLSSSDFIEKFTHWPGFISSLIFSRTSWNMGESSYNDLFLGYKFLARIYAGLKDLNCVYVGAPALIQRRGIQAWKSDWPRYWLVNMPRLLVSFDDKGTTKNALSHWNANEVTLKRVLIDCLVAKAFKYKFNDSFWNEATRYQPFARGLVIQIVRIIAPPILMSWLYFNLGKYKKS